jgi:hypothetical protein
MASVSSLNDSCFVSLTTLLLRLLSNHPPEGVESKPRPIDRDSLLLILDMIVMKNDVKGVTFA